MREVMLAISVPAPSSTLEDADRCSLRALNFFEGKFIRDEVEFLTACSQVVSGGATVSDVRKSRRAAFKGRIEVFNGEDDLLLRVGGSTKTDLLLSDAKRLARSELDGMR